MMHGRVLDTIIGPYIQPYTKKPGSHGYPTFILECYVRHLQFSSALPELSLERFTGLLIVGSLALSLTSLYSIYTRL